MRLRHEDRGHRWHGLIGSKLVGLLRARGHEALAAAPNTGVNSLTGEGLARALAGAQVLNCVACTMV